MVRLVINYNSFFPDIEIFGKRILTEQLVKKTVGLALAVAVYVLFKEARPALALHLTKIKATVCDPQRIPPLLYNAAKEAFANGTYSKNMRMMML